PCPQADDAAASSRAIGPVLPAIPTPSVSRMKTLAARRASAGISANRVVTTWSAKVPMASIFVPPQTDDSNDEEVIEAAQSALSHVGRRSGRSSRRARCLAKLADRCRGAAAAYRHR